MRDEINQLVSRDGECPLRKCFLSRLKDYEVLLVKYIEMSSDDEERASLSHDLLLQCMAVNASRATWGTFNEPREIDAKVSDDGDNDIVDDDVDANEMTASSDDEVDDIDSYTGVYSKERILGRVGDYGYKVNDEFLFGEDVEWKFRVVLYDLYLGRFGSSVSLVDREIFPRQSEYGGSYFCGGSKYKYKLPAPWSRLNACPDARKLRERDINSNGDMIASPIPCDNYESIEDVMGTFVGWRYEFISTSTLSNRAFPSADFYHPDLLRACLRPDGVDCPFYHYYRYGGNRYDWPCSCPNPPLSTVRPGWLSQLTDTPPDAYVVIPGVERRYLATKKRGKKVRKRNLGKRVYLTDGKKGRRNGKRIRCDDN